MGKVSLFLVLTLGATLSALQLSAATSKRAESAFRSGHGTEILARQAAHTGFAEARHVLASGTAPGVPSVLRGRSADGTYESRLATLPGAPRTVRVRVEGRSGGDRHVVEALFREPEGAGSPGATLELVPPYLRYAALSGGPLRLAVLPRVRTQVPGVNASVHTNGTLNLLPAVGGALGVPPVEGFGSYAGGLLALPLTDPAASFRPVANPHGLASLRRTAAVDIPTLDLQALGRSAEQPSAGQLRLFGRIALGTREAPRTVHVRGNLVLVDTRFEGYGSFVVDGSVIVESTLTGLSDRMQGRTESHVSVYAGGPILFNGLGEVEGTFFSNHSATFSAATTLYGSVAARGAVNLLVAPAIRFLPPSPALTIGLPGNPPPQAMRQVAVREWEVVDGS